MFKYVKFIKVETKDTTLEFRATDDKVKVNHFNVSVVSLEGTASEIDVLIQFQSEDIKCEVISQDEFKTFVSDSAQLIRIRNIVKERIASKYSIADEIAMSKKAEDDEKRISYELFVAECIEKGRVLKEAIGY